jgi:hypothetical protein
MNYSAVALVILAAYLWHANSLHNEIGIIKKLLVVIYDTIELKLSAVSQEMSTFHGTVMQSISRLQNMTKHSIDLVLVNSAKIDVINNKIDTLLQNH